MLHCYQMLGEIGYLLLRFLAFIVHVHVHVYVYTYGCARACSTFECNDNDKAIRIIGVGVVLMPFFAFGNYRTECIITTFK